MFLVAKSNCIKFGGKVNAEKRSTQSVFTAKFESIPKISYSPVCVSNCVKPPARQKQNERFCFHTKEYTMEAVRWA